MGAARRLARGAVEISSFPDNFRKYMEISRAAAIARRNLGAQAGLGPKCDDILYRNAYPSLFSVFHIYLLLLLGIWVHVPPAAAAVCAVRAGRHVGREEVPGYRTRLGEAVGGGPHERLHALILVAQPARVGEMCD